MKGYLKAIEILGQMILELEEEARYKDFELEQLKNKIKELDGEKNVYKNSN